MAEVPPQTSNADSTVETGESANATAEGTITVNDSTGESQAGSSSSAPKQCASCSKIEEDPEEPLKLCAKCHTVRYCSRECQKTDFKKHKKICASFAQTRAQSGGQRAVQAAPQRPKQAHRGGLQKWQFDT